MVTTLSLSFSLSLYVDLMIIWMIIHIYIGTKQERKDMRTEWVTGSEFPIIVTSYEVVLADKAALQHVHRPNNPDNPPHPIPSLSLYLCMCVIHQVFCAVCCVLCVCVGGLEDHHR